MNPINVVSIDCRNPDQPTNYACRAHTGGYTATVLVQGSWNVCRKANRNDPTECDWNRIEPGVNWWVVESKDGLALVIAGLCTVVDGAVPGRILERIVQRISTSISKLPITNFDPPIIVRGTINAGAPAIGAANYPMYLSLFSRKYLD